MDQEDQPITFLAIDASSGNSICIEHLGGVESLREWSVLVKNTLYKTVGKSKLEQNKNRRSNYRYRDNRPTTDH